VIRLCRFVQMALGLQHMHANRILHRDLKTQNIFLLGNGRLVSGGTTGSQSHGLLSWVEGMMCS
jgi:serine/threonine protein kinase